MNGDALLGSDHVYDSSRGEFISKKHQRVAEIIADYDPDLRLLYIPRADRTEADVFPFAVAYCREGAEPELVFYVAEEEVDERLVARLFMNDSRRSDPGAYLDALTAAKEAVRLKEDLERREEAQDIAAFMIRSPLHVINMGGGKKVYT